MKRAVRPAIRSCAWLAVLACWGCGRNSAPPASNWAWEAAVSHESITGAVHLDRLSCLPGQPVTLRLVLRTDRPLLHPEEPLDLTWPGMEPVDRVAPPATFRDGGWSQPITWLFQAGPPAVLEPAPVDLRIGDRTLPLNLPRFTIESSNPGDDLPEPQPLGR